MVVIDFIKSLDASVLLPIIIFIFALILATPLAQAFRSALVVGIGFIGLHLIIDLLTNSLGPAASAMVERFDLQMKIIDIGWPATASISYGTILGSLAIPLGIGVNLVLLTTGLTRTLNIDIWNYWHCAFTGSLVYVLTGDFLLGLTTIIVHLLFVFWCADYMAKDIEDFYQFKQMTFPHAASAPSYLFAKAIDKLFDRIPFFKDIEMDEQTIQRKFGILGDEVIIGSLIGLIIGILAKYPFADILQLAVQTAAVIFLMPKMVSFLMEGLIPISEAANEWMKRKFKNKNLYIGMDSALSVGHSTVLSVSILLIPITLLLSILLPGNQVLPFGDLATIPFLICLMLPVFKGNMIRSLFAGAIYISVGLYIATWISPLFTRAAETAGFDFGLFTQITSLVDGAVWTTFLFIGPIRIAGWLGLSLIGFILILMLIKRRKLGRGEK